MSTCGTLYVRSELPIIRPPPPLPVVTSAVVKCRVFKAHTPWVEKGKPSLAAVSASRWPGLEGGACGRMMARREEPQIAYLREDVISRLNDNVLTTL
mmetsp:Transcript_56804/g.130451  ORF Transcript_56804/g.130451 Transcript_56804/m.130451 type:complete len:97 (-) Transcript_56804:69-359(-)